MKYKPSPDRLIFVYRFHFNFKNLLCFIKNTEAHIRTGRWQNGVQNIKQHISQ